MKEDKEDVKILEKISLKLRKTIIVSKLFTILIVITLIAACIGLNIWIKEIDLPEIDITENKIYTLSEKSKEALKILDQDVKIYAYGINEEDPVMGLIKQYDNATDKISFEMLTAESNLEKVKEFDLEEGNTCVVLESGTSNRVISTSEFKSIDYSTYEEIDETEQVLTNSILTFAIVNKPKVYFITGHDEYGEELTNTFRTALVDEAFEVETINLMTSGNVPEDCDVLAILSPSKDFLENEAQAVIDYINKGGNLFVTSDLLNKEGQFVNLDKILSLYGVNIKNGYVVEADSNYAMPNYPYVFIPNASQTSTITQSIKPENGVILTLSEKLDFVSDEELNNLKVEKEELLGTSDKALFISDLTKDLSESINNAKTGHYTIASLLTKTISDGGSDESQTDDNSNSIKSKLIISANGSFLTDNYFSEVSSQYMIVNIGSNKDFAINTIAYLADREEGLIIRKTVDSKLNVFTVTDNQYKIVLAIIFIIPVIIVVVGIIIWIHRKKRK